MAWPKAWVSLDIETPELVGVGASAGLSTGPDTRPGGWRDPEMRGNVVLIWDVMIGGNR